MELNFLFLGKSKVKYLDAGIQDYLKRLKRVAKPKEVILKEVKLFPSAGPKDEQEAMEKEGKTILEFTKQRQGLVALDLSGENLSSEELASWVQKNRLNFRGLNFALGNAWGLDKAVLQKADLCLSLGAFTWTHEIARFLIVEQVYRAFTILNGFPYHK